MFTNLANNNRPTPRLTAAAAVLRRRFRGEDGAEATARRTAPDRLPGAGNSRELGSYGHVVTFE